MRLALLEALLSVPILAFTAVSSSTVESGIHLAATHVQNTLGGGIEWREDWGAGYSRKHDRLA
jgi:hypothetical protein